MNKPKRIMIVVGEPSGDAHAAKLVASIREVLGDGQHEFFGSAGPKMRAACVEAIVESDDLAIMGLPEIGRALPMFWRAFAKLKAAAAERKPDIVILVDFPEFNLKLAKTLKRQGNRVVYFISPQLWAWRQYRIRGIKKYVDLLITILPFEKDWYAQRGVKHVEYVGNPLVKEIDSVARKGEFCAANALEVDKPIIALLPGSRKKEIFYILPPMLSAAALMSDVSADLQFVIATASSKRNEYVEQIIKETAKKLDLPSVKIVCEQTYDLLKVADVAAVASGTATLETGILGTPLAVVYKASSLNYRLIRPLIDIEHFGLINLIAGYRLAAEFIQDDFTPNALADELLRILKPVENRQMREKLAEAVRKLGEGGASKRAAEAIVAMLLR